MRRNAAPAQSNEWDDWSAPIPTAPRQPPAGAKPMMPAQPPSQAPYSYQPPAAASPYTYQPPPQSLPTYQQQPPTTPQPAPTMPAPFVPQTGSTGNFMMPGMTSGQMTSGQMTGQMQAPPSQTGGGGMPGIMGMGSFGSAERGAAAAPGETTPSLETLASSGAASLAGLAGMDGGAASLAGQMAGRAAMDLVGKAGFDPNIAKNFSGSRLNVLRYYFDVNNAYVLSKLKILMLPYRHKEWERRVQAVPGGGYQPHPPSEDVNAPDLYLPLMSYATYILVAGFVSGADGRFTPEVLASTSYTGLGFVLFEVGCIKLAFYLLPSQSGGGSGLASLDLIAISGYKFLAAVLVILAFTFLGTMAGYLAIAIAGANIGTFMAKTLHQSLLESTGFSPGFMSEGLGSPGRSEKKRMQNYALLVVAWMQPFFFWYLARV